MMTERDVENTYVNADYAATQRNRALSLTTGEEDLTFCGCCAGCTIFWFMIVLIVGTICFYVFSILGLVYDWDTVSDCNSSHLRELVITYLVICWLKLGTGSLTSKELNRGTLMLSLVISVLMCGGIAIWSGIEVLKLVCTNIKGTLLYGVGMTIFIVNTIFGGVAFLGVVAMVLVAALKM